MAYVGCDKVAAQLLLALPGALAGAVYAGNQMNHMALSPKYAGTMYGITNAAANMCGFLAPYVIGLIIEGRVRRERVTRLRMFNFELVGNLGAVEDGVLLGGGHKHRGEPLLRGVRQRQGAALVEVATTQHR